MTTYSLRLRAGTIPLAAQALGVGAGVMYATIEEGRVTAINFGTLPTSTDTTLYFDLTGYDPLPAVNDYFSDVCQTFSSLPPVIPAGDVAPPYTPGGTPPTPGDPNYPDPELPPTDDPVPLASTAPMFLSFHADGTDSVAITGTGDLTEVSPLMRSIVRMQDICAVRLHATVDTPDTGLTLKLCFSTDDGATWEELSPGKTGPSVTLAAAGAVVGAFLNVDPVVEGDTLLGVCVEGTGSAVVGNIFATLYVKTTNGVCIEIAEGGCVPPADYPIYAEDFSTYDTYEDFIAARQYPSDPDYWNLFSDLYLPSTSGGFAGFSTSVTLPGQPHSVYSDYNVANFPAFEVGWGTLFESVTSDVTVQWVVSLAPNIIDGLILDIDGVTPVTSSSTEHGFVLGAWEDKAPSGEGGARYFHYLLIRAGRVFHGVYQGSFAIQSEVDIGDAADFLLDPATQFTFRADYVGSDARIRIYVDPACPDNPDTPTLWATVTGPRCSTSSQWRTVEIATVFNCRMPSPTAMLYHHQYSYNNDATLYGF